MNKRIYSHIRTQAAVALYFLGRFDESALQFHQTLLSAQRDGDMYFEANALYWKSLIQFITVGECCTMWVGLCSVILMLFLIDCYCWTQT